MFGLIDTSVLVLFTDPPAQRLDDEGDDGGHDRREHQGHHGNDDLHHELLESTAVEQTRLGGQQAELTVNGESWSLTCATDETLLETIRARLGLTGTKRSCDRGECGACAVLLGDRAVPACLRLTVTVEEPVTTVEGLAPEITDLREAFADLGAFQCGFCTPGQLVAAEACLRRGGQLDDTTVRGSLQGNICRCTGYAPIIEAVLAVSQMREQEEGS